MATRTTTVFDKLQAVKELPKQNRAGGTRGPRSTPLTQALDRIVADTKLHGRWVALAANASAQSSSGTATSLRKRFGGKTYAQGFEFAVRQAEVDGSPQHVVFAFYDPNAIVEGGMEKYEAEQAAKAEQRAAKAAANKSAAA
jgi:hypothetical protein